MSALYRSKKGLKMTEISGALKVSNGNITGIIDRLIQDGHVLRVAVEGDRRTNLVSLTNKGRAQFEVYANAHESWVNIILEKLSEQNGQDLINLLDTISYNRSS
jgi:DNA-binding MarR family transcriptional regulator